ncbi:hypothetical protein [Natrarchaeobius oligotrophus]|uniref:Uncharacterized protein n=1 Tax=Natrarchaeobius chitinivorans TaxID=1679083 RepID=A0A3N6N4G6_NATCH|nr:hypothetical protein [Natrarchaeobius chitinivorans]RQH02647.1 hypothetical protein EA472_04950 [Natrarchaeobius chitinivorans]
MTTVRHFPYEDAPTSQYTAQFHTHPNEPPRNGYRYAAHELADIYDENRCDVLAISNKKNGGEMPWPWTEWSDFPYDWEDRYPIQNHGEGPADQELDLLAIRGNYDKVDNVFNTIESEFVNEDLVGGMDRVEAAVEQNALCWWPHPGRYWNVEDTHEYDLEDLIGVFEEYPSDELLGIEVWNQGYRYRDLYLYDYLLTEFYRRADGFRPIYSLAVDDMSGSGSKRDDFDLNSGYCEVFMEELTVSAFREAMENGHWYPTVSRPIGELPPVIESVDHDESAGTLTVEASNYDYAVWISEGEVIETGAELNYEENDDVRSYARAHLSRDGRAGEATTQPIAFEVTDR